MPAVPKTPAPIDDDVEVITLVLAAQSRFRRSSKFYEALIELPISTEKCAVYPRREGQRLESAQRLVYADKKKAADKTGGAFAIRKIKRGVIETYAVWRVG